MQAVELGDQFGQLFRQGTEHLGRQLEEDRQTPQHRLQPLEQAPPLAPAKWDSSVFHPDRAPPVVSEAKKDAQIEVVRRAGQMVELDQSLRRPPEEIPICLAADSARRRGVSPQAEASDLASHLPPDLAAHRVPSA
jgi:hypothetical protein